MTDTPTNGETAKPGDSSNDGTNNSTPPASQPKDNAVDPAEVERLRKEAEHNKLRANQLENELAAKAKAEEEARQKQLEEQNEWKTIAEQNKAKADALEKEREEAVAKIELEKSQQDIYQEFPDDVVELAKETDLKLSENSDEAKEALKTKLTKLSERVSSSANVGPNNQNTNTKQPSREELLQEHAKGDPKAFDQAISGLNFVKHSKIVNNEE